MADISLCPSPDCPARTYCRRNEASGTQPSERRQRWTAYTWIECDGQTICDGYWPIRTTLIAQAEGAADA